MPKPAMTPEDVQAITEALHEMHAAEIDVQKAFGFWRSQAGARANGRV